MTSTNLEQETTELVEKTPLINSSDSKPQNLELSISSSNVKEDLTTEEFIEYLRSQTIGYYEKFKSPFINNKLQRILYCDWIASGRQLLCIENYIKNQVSTLYKI